MMNRYWKSIIHPIINLIQAKHIVEIGSNDGFNTKNILDYCADAHGYLTSIDPSPHFDVEEFKLKYPTQFTFINKLSLDALPTLHGFDTILIDGDHNWYTVYNELKIIEANFKDNLLFPLIFLHEVDWPYARRDKYSNPNSIPDKYLQYHKQLGISPHDEKLVEKGGLNSNSFNAFFSNTPKNGVLTAIEDFIYESSMEFTFIKIPLFNGLGILFKKDLELEKEINEIINNSDLFQLIENELIETQASLAHAQKTRKYYEDKNDLLLEEKKTQMQQFNQMREEKEKQYKELVDLTNKNISNEIMINDFENEIQILKNENRQLKINLNESAINLKTVTSQRNLINSVNEDNKLLLQKIKTENQKYKKEIGDFETKLNLLASQKIKILLQLNEERNKIQEVYAENEKYEKEIKDLKTRTTILSSQKNIALNELNKEKNKIQETVSENLTEIENLKIKIEILSSQKNIALNEISKEKNRIQEVSAENEKYLKEIDSIKKENNNFKSEIETKNAELSELISTKYLQQEEIMELQNIINDNAAKIESYEVSNSWKLTRPFRVISNMLKYKRKK